MLRKKMVVISSIVIILAIASFFIGALYSPYGRVGTDTSFRTEPIIPLPNVEVATTPTPAAMGVETERMVIYTAYISIETGEIERLLAKTRALAEGYGGYVAGSSRSSYGMQSVAEISIRVPKDKFHLAVQEIEGYGRVLDERTTSEDITQQYIDLEARLENLLRQEKRLSEILDSARTVDEILSVERELERVRERIESLQGQIDYLDRSVDMSVITVRLSEPPPPFTPPGMDWGETFETALRGLFVVVRAVVILSVSLLPICIIGVSAYYVYRRRKLREKK